MSEDELLVIVEADFLTEKLIPYNYKINKNKMLIAIKLLVDSGELTPQYFHTDFEYAVYEMLVDCLAEMACADGNQIYKGSIVTYTKVIDQINKITTQDRSLFDFVLETIEDYVNAAKENEIRDKRKYLKSVIWNSFSTYKVKFESEFARTFTG